MTIFDLVFIAVFLATVTTLIVACTGRFKVLLPLAVCLAIYYGAVLLTAHTKQVSVGDPMCSDDWCASVEHVSRKNGTVSVDFKIWSRAKRATMRETNIEPSITDEQNHRYEVTGSEGPPFDSALAPNESLVTKRTFQVSPESQQLDLRLRKPFGFPTNLIIDIADVVVRLNPV
jgi:hypothetical protein